MIAVPKGRVLSSLSKRLAAAGVSPEVLLADDRTLVRDDPNSNLRFLLLKPDDVAVELYAGALNSTGKIDKPQLLRMTYGQQMAPGRHLFIGRIDCRASGRQGFAIRVVPGSTDLATPFEPGLILWN